jgi:metal-responsive CopG/Arc/MetJ family transcriptional regulator
MKHHIGLTIDSQLYREIERIRGREKRSTFVEHIIRLGLKSYANDEDVEGLEPQRIRNTTRT